MRSLVVLQRQQLRRRVADQFKVTAVAAAVLVLLASCGGDTSTSKPSPSSPASSGQPSPSRAGGWVGLRWSRPNVIPDQGSPSGVAAWRGGYVAVGQSSDGTRYVGAAFVSADGVQWLRTSTFSVWLGRPVATATRLVAVVNIPGPPPSVEAWGSLDGRTWQRDARLALAGASMTTLAAAGTTIVAVGTDSSGRTTSWRSDDGAEWSQGQPLPPRAIVRKVAATSDGFIAVGRDGEPDVASGGVGAPGVGRPAGWWSADGRSWTAASVEGTAAAGAQLGDVFRVRDGYFAIGSDTTNLSENPRSPLVWVSADARDWHLQGRPAHWGMAGTNSQQAVVFTRATNGTPNLEAWMTQDGRQWAQLSFSGDTADIPAFETGAGQPSRVDEVFVASQGVVVIGQQNGHIATWFAEGESH